MSVFLIFFEERKKIEFPWELKKKLSNVKLWFIFRSRWLVLLIWKKKIENRLPIGRNEKSQKKKLIRFDRIGRRTIGTQCAVNVDVLGNFPRILVILFPHRSSVWRVKLRAFFFHQLAVGVWGGEWMEK